VSGKKHRNITLDAAVNSRPLVPIPEGHRDEKEDMLNDVRD
jgi:hypothetical protein